IIKRIDGATLLQKIDGKTLAAKVLPYIQVVVPVAEAYGPVLKVKKYAGPFSNDLIQRTSAACPAVQTSVGGGLSIAGTTRKGEASGITVSVDNVIASLVPLGQIVLAAAKMGNSGNVMAVAKCLQSNAIVSLRP